MTNRDLSNLHALRRRRMLQQNQLGTVIGLAVVAVLVGLIFSLGGGAETAAEPLFNGQPAGPAASEGQRLYNQYCFGCHGPTGEGNQIAGIPPLDETGTAWQRSRGELESHILDGGATMPELSGLVSPEDAGFLIDFIQTWWTEEQVQQFEDSSE